MARSSHIYIAWNHADELLGAWTVKHELIKVAKLNAKQSTYTYRDYQFAKVIRTRDGSCAGEGTHQVFDITDEILKEIG